MDHSLVRALRAEVADLLEDARRSHEAAGRPRLGGEDERQLARSVITRVVDRYVQRLLEAGQQPPSVGEEQALADAVHAALYGAGRLQTLLDDPDIEDIDINGADQVFITYADGRRDRGAPVADSDDELVELVQTLASYAGLNSRPFDAANPQLDLRLPDGSRLSAVMHVCERPGVSIRRDRLEKVSLADLVGNGTLSQHLADFLTAAVLARHNIIIVGETGSGKTTLLRALANVIPADERIITVENALELGVHKHTDLHPDVVALEARLPNAEGLGAVTMPELVRRTLRMNPDRVIVGESLGPEIITLLNAMSQGNDGSLSTLHARDARRAFGKIAIYAKQAEERMDPEATHMLVEDALDFVIFVQKAKPRAYRNSSVRRYVAQVLEVNGLDGGRVLASEVWTPGPDGRAVLNPGVAITRIDDLIAAGYAPDAYGADGIRWDGG